MPGRRYWPRSFFYAEVIVIDVTQVTDAIGAAVIAIIAVGGAVILADVAVSIYDWLRYTVGGSQYRGEVDSFDQERTDDYRPRGH